MGRIDRSLRTQLNARLQRADLTTPGYTMMFVLNRLPGISNAELARRAGLTPQTTLQTLQSLAGRGLVEREPTAGGSRKLESYLTPAGLELIRKCEQDASSIEERMLRDFTRSERAQFEQFLRRAAENLGLSI